MVEQVFSNKVLLAADMQSLQSAITIAKARRLEITDAVVDAERIGTFHSTGRRFSNMAERTRQRVEADALLLKVDFLPDSLTNLVFWWLSAADAHNLLNSRRDIAPNPGWWHGEQQYWQLKKWLQTNSKLSLQRL